MYKRQVILDLPVPEIQQQTGAAVTRPVPPGQAVLFGDGPSGDGVYLQRPHNPADIMRMQAAGGVRIDGPQLFEEPFAALRFRPSAQGGAQGWICLLYTSRCV